MGWWHLFPKIVPTELLTWSLTSRKIDAYRQSCVHVISNKFLISAVARLFSLLFSMIPFVTLARVFKCLTDGRLEPASFIPIALSTKLHFWRRRVKILQHTSAKYLGSLVVGKSTQSYIWKRWSTWLCFHGASLPSTLRTTILWARNSHT